MTEMSDPVELSKPILRKGDPVTELQVRKPFAGELRGLELSAIIRGQYDQTLICLSRCCTPSVVVQELEKLEPFDLGQLSGTLISFFTTAPKPLSPSIQ